MFFSVGFVHIRMLNVRWLQQNMKNIISIFSGQYTTVDVITCKLYLCALTVVYFVASNSVFSLASSHIVTSIDVAITERQDKNGNIKMANRYAFCCCFFYIKFCTMTMMI